MLKYSISLITFFSFFCQSQEFGTDSVFNVLISRTYGDLNKDNIPDLVIVTQDTVNEKAPYRLEVFFTEIDSSRTSVVSTTKAIMEQFPNGPGGIIDGGFDKISIRKGVLWIEEGFTRGNMAHKFRYQNDRFELIGFTYVNGGICCFQTIDFNLSTGRRIERNGTNYDSEPMKISDTIRKIHPLPNLAEFEVLMGEYF